MEYGIKYFLYYYYYFSLFLNTSVDIPDPFFTTKRKSNYKYLCHLCLF